MTERGLYYDELVKKASVPLELIISEPGVKNSIDRVSALARSPAELPLLIWSLMTGKTVQYTNGTIVANLEFEFPMPENLESNLKSDSFEISTQVVNHWPTDSNPNRKIVVLKHSLRDSGNITIMEFYRRIMSQVNEETNTSVSPPVLIDEKDMPPENERNTIYKVKYSGVKLDDSFLLAENVVATFAQTVEFSQNVENFTPLHLDPVWMKEHSIYRRPIANSSKTIMDLIVLSNNALPDGTIMQSFSATTPLPIYTLFEEEITVDTPRSATFYSVHSHISSIAPSEYSGFHNVVMEIQAVDPVYAQKGPEKNKDGILCRITQSLLWPSNAIA